MILKNQIEEEKILEEDFDKPNPGEDLYLLVKRNVVCYLDQRGEYLKIYAYKDDFEEGSKQTDEFKDWPEVKHIAAKSRAIGNRTLDEFAE